MTIKHRFLLFINKIKFKKKAKKELKKIDDITFLDYLNNRLNKLEKEKEEIYYFTSKEKENSIILDIRIKEIKSIIEAYMEYGKK